MPPQEGEHRAVIGAAWPVSHHRPRAAGAGGVAPGYVPRGQDGPKTAHVSPTRRTAAGSLIFKGGSSSSAAEGGYF